MAKILTKEKVRSLARSSKVICDWFFCLLETIINRSVGTGQVTRIRITRRGFRGLKRTLSLFIYILPPGTRKQQL